jgi:hypothetical protein
MGATRSNSKLCNFEPNGLVPQVTDALPGPQCPAHRRLQCTAGLVWVWTASSASSGCEKEGGRRRIGPDMGVGVDSGKHCHLAE